MVSIDLAEKKDVFDMARIHQAEINQGFLSWLGVAFLECFYSALVESKSSFCVIAKENGQVVGFISGVTGMQDFYVHFLKTYFFQSLRLLFKKFFNFAHLKKIIETMVYPVKEKNLPGAELLTMAVSAKFQGRGIANQMLPKFLSEMKKRNIRSFKVLVGEGLAPAIGFYEKSKFVFVKKIILHGDRKSNMYIYNL